WNDMHIVNVGDDANDALQLRRALAVDFQDRIGPKHVPIDRVLIGEHSLRQSLADNRDALFTLHVGLIEIAARNDGNAQRGKKSRRDDTILRARVVFARAVKVAISGELQSGTGADITPRSDHPKGGFIHTRKCINPTYDFLVKIDNLPACLSVKYSGNVNGKDMPRVHRGPRPLQCEKRSDDQTRPGQQHERCADLRDNEHALTTLAAGQLDTAAREVQCT